MGDAKDDTFDRWDRADFARDEDGPGGRGRPRKEQPGYDLGEVEVVHETDAALLVRGSGLSSDPFGLKDPHEESWIPKSQVHPDSPLQPDCGVRAKGRMTITNWFAEKRGLV